MGATKLPFLLSGVTNLALGLAFLYLWWRVLRRQYALLIALARLLAVADTALSSLMFPHQNTSVAVRLISNILSAVTVVCLIVACWTCWVAGRGGAPMSRSPQR